MPKTPAPSPAALSVETNDAFRYHWTVWKLMGIHAPACTRPQLYRCYAIFINAIVTLLFPLTLCANLLHSTNMQQLSENLTITVTDVIANLKFLNVFFVLPKLLLIKDIVAQLDANARSLAERAVLQQAVHTAHNSFCIFGAIYVLGTLLSVLKVAVASERLLLYPAWFYVDWRQSNVAYALVFSYQLFGLAVQALQNCANDSLPPAYLCVLTGHMKALQLRLQKLGGQQAVSQPLSACALEQNYKALVSCIEDHLRILNGNKVIPGAYTTSKLVARCRTALNNLSERKQVHLCWVIGHRGITGHCEADELVRNGTTLPDVIEPVGAPLLAVKMAFKQAYLRLAMRLRAEERACSTSRATWPSLNLNRNKQLLRLSLHAIIQHILSVTCLAQFICSALVQCTVGLHFLYVADERDRSAQVLSIIFFVAVTLEVFIVCYFGQYVRAQSEALAEAFYACNWLPQLPQFKRNLLLAIMRTQQPCALYAGGYIPVDLPTFMRLMKYAYSAFTLLMRFK